jgi:hypothetical protein
VAYVGLVGCWCVCVSANSQPPLEVAVQRVNWHCSFKEWSWHCSLLVLVPVKTSLYLYTHVQTTCMSFDQVVEDYGLCGPNKLKHQLLALIGGNIQMVNQHCSFKGGCWLMRSYCSNKDITLLILMFKPGEVFRPSCGLWPLWVY